MESGTRTRGQRRAGPREQDLAVGRRGRGGRRGRRGRLRLSRGGRGARREPARPGQPPRPDARRAASRRTTPSRRPRARTCRTSRRGAFTPSLFHGSCRCTISRTAASWSSTTAPTAVPTSWPSSRPSCRATSIGDPGALSGHEDADRADRVDQARRLRRFRRVARPPLHHRLPRDRPPPAVECTHERTVPAAPRDRWAGVFSVVAGGCASYISPLQPPPYRDQVAAPYDVTWTALIRALAFDNVPLRAVAKDSGVIASDDIVSPIGVYADCGSKGDKALEGEAIVPFTVFVRPNGGPRISRSTARCAPSASANRVVSRQIPTTSASRRPGGSRTSWIPSGASSRSSACRPSCPNS